MSGPGRDASLTLADGRVLEYWDGGDPDGRPFVYQPGTPVSRVLGRWGHAAALASGVRLIVLNRPGYGGSSTIPPDRGLLDVGRDTAQLAERLALEAFGVFGCSGGGPYAVATAVAAPEAVRALGLVGAVGPWRELEPPTFAAEDRACLDMRDAGDAFGARDCFRRDVESHRGRQSPEEAAAEIIGDEASAVANDPAYRELWAENMRVILDNPDGYIFDNLAWGGTWDVDPGDVAAPAFLLYGSEDRHCSPDGHARWYMDRLGSRQELVVLPGAAHIEVIDGHWPEVLAGMLRAWDSGGNGAGPA